ncbi:porin family protein [Rufibacter aurantiacus]|uniref:porin family protein n=1 Tax=Rufibacter aurantiacus TaxID=2817374 RepID=UPI001B306AED|nr:porin family protein [Rufibacter aurantiacus]
MRKLLPFIAALFTTYFAQAQESTNFGVVGGANFSNWTGANVGGTKSKAGYHVGAFLDYKFSAFASFRPEIQLSNKGFKAEGEGDAILRAQVNYIDIPVLFRVNAIGLFFEGGPSIGYKISSRLKVTEGDSKISTPLNGLKRVDIGYAAGLGYELPAGIGIGLRYNGGLSKLPRKSEAKVYNSNIQLSLSYILIRK